MGSERELKRNLKKMNKNGFIAKHHLLPSADRFVKQTAALDCTGILLSMSSPIKGSRPPFSTTKL